MSILDIKKQVKNYLIISIICFIVSFIYEMLSHGVYSNYMIFAGLIPLILGTGFYLLIRKINFSYKSRYLYNSFISCLTVWMYVNGILEIYGTTNMLVNYYIYGAIFFLILTITSVLFTKN